MASIGVSRGNKLRYRNPNSIRVANVMTRVSLASVRERSRITLLCLASILGGCSTSGAPSFDLFGAFFPAWLLCGVIGIAGAVLAWVFVGSGLANVLPYQLAVCTAIGVITAVMVWFVWFGR
jgi:YtcA family